MPSVAGKGESLTSSAQITVGNNLFWGVLAGIPNAREGTMEYTESEITYITLQPDSPSNPRARTVTCRHPNSCR
eukprot:jgi/Botrbrau1/14574/Bobra.27_3s0013.1